MLGFLRIIRARKLGIAQNAQSCSKRVVRNTGSWQKSCRGGDGHHPDSLKNLGVRFLFQVFFCHALWTTFCPVTPHTLLCNQEMGEGERWISCFTVSFIFLTFFFCALKHPENVLNPQKRKVHASLVDSCLCLPVSLIIMFGGFSVFKPFWAVFLFGPQCLLCILSGVSGPVVLKIVFVCRCRLSVTQVTVYLYRRPLGEHRLYIFCSDATRSVKQKTLLCTYCSLAPGLFS